MNRTDDVDRRLPQHSPVYRAFWSPADAGSPELFAAPSADVPADVQPVLTRSLEVLRQHREHGTLRGSDGKHSASVLTDLAAAGYWGLLIDRDYGGSGAGLRHFLPFLTQAAVID